MRLLIVLDAMRGFYKEEFDPIIKKLNAYLEENTFDNVLYTRLVKTKNLENTKNDMVNSFHLKQDKKIFVKKIKYAKHIDRTCYQFSTKIKNYIEKLMPDEVYLCGVNYNRVVDVLVYQLEKMGVKKVIRLDDLLMEVPVVVKKYDYRDLSTEIKFKSIHGFYMCDMHRCKLLNYDKPYSCYTVLLFAVMEWLLDTCKTSERLQRTLSYYYKFFKSAYHPDAYREWAERECVGCLHESGDLSLCMSIIIAWYCNKPEELEEYLSTCMGVIRCDSDMFFACRLLGYIILSLKIKTGRSKYMNYVYKTMGTTKNELLELAEKNTWVKMIINAAEKMPTTKNIMEVYNEFLQCTMNNYMQNFINVIIAEAYYRDFPVEAIEPLRKKLPDKFRLLLLKLSVERIDRVYF